MRKIFAALAALPLLVFAQENVQTQDDWIVVCDNTGTCRMAGYQSDDTDAQKNPPGPLSVLFTRAAGADAAVTGEITLLSVDENKALPEKVALTIDDKAHGNIALKEGRGSLEETQITALINALRAGKADITVNDGQEFWQLSPEGAGAIMLAFDSLQKRIGTPSSLASPGLNDKAIPEPQAKPVIQQAAVSTEKTKTYGDGDTYKQLRTLLQQADHAANPNEDDRCVLLNDEEMQRLNWAYNAIHVDVLDDKHHLAATLCDTGAYNLTYAYAVYDPATMTVRQFEAIPGGEGEDYSGYHEGRISGFYAMRGIGDCVGYSTWVWTGEAFVLAEEQNTGLCRGFPGGAWDLPTVVSEIQAPAS